MVISKTKFLPLILSTFIINNALANDETVDITDISLEQLLNVEVFSASKFNQKTSEAPSKVTVIDSNDIREYGYRNLNDILNSIAGLYSTYDRNYSYLGVRGFGLAGDYNTRVLLLLDGQRVNENIYDSFGLDYDGIVNVELIKRVEFSSGPGSAIYGANAFFGVINIITKSASDIDGIQASVTYANENSRSARLTAGKIFTNNVEALVSISAYRSDGADLYFAEFDDPATNNGIAKDRDYTESHNLLLKLKYESWGLQTTYNERTKGIPTASYGQEFNMPPSETIDAVGLVSLTYDSFINNESQVYVSLTLGRYEYSGDFIYDYPPITVNRDETVGSWWNLESRYQTTYFNNQRIIFGLEFQSNPKQDQENFDIEPFFSYLDDARSSEIFGIYIQDEIRLSDNVILNAGVRYDKNNIDDNNQNKSIVNPRLALIYSIQPATTLKLIYGTAYRNANSYELYYGTTLGYLPSIDLEPEQIDTVEFDIEHYINNNLKINASIYTNKTENLIGLNSDLNGDVFYDNLEDVSAVGGDFEAEYVSMDSFKIRASYSYVDTEIDNTNEKLTNSPENMLKLNLSSPAFNRKAKAGIEFQYLSDRLTPQGNKVSSYSITNLTISSNKIYSQLELSASIYNIFDKQYEDPASEEHIQNSIAQDGRVFRVKAIYGF